MSKGGRSDALPGLVGVLTVAAFLVFGQAFMVAPILPRLARVFGASVGVTGLSVPAYLVPYGLASLAWGPLTDRVGRRPVIAVCLVGFAVVTAATASAGGVVVFIAWRVGAGLVASGVVPVSVALIADTLPYARRGHALGWLFGGMAGGMAVGSAAGALAEPIVGWRGLFWAVAAAGVSLSALVWVRVPARRSPTRPMPLRAVIAGYTDLLRLRRSRRVYGYIGLNALLQSGIYTWLGVYLQHRFALDTTEIGLAVLGYGIPGLILGPMIGKAADRYGRARLIPVGVAVTATAAFALATPVPLAAVNLVIAGLSLGYDLTQPLLAGIVTDLPAPAGQAVALMAVILFCGFGAGSLAFQAVMTVGLTPALVVFGVAATLAATAAVPAFTGERAARA